jgi:signal peptidase II
MRRVWLLLLTVLVVGLDQASKAAVAAHLAPGERVHLLGPLALHRLTNTGLAFGVLAGIALYVVVALAALTFVLLLFQLPRGRLALCGAGLLLGGGASNLVDRLRLGAVSDFLQPGAWPAFNLADACVVSGSLLLALTLLRALPADESGSQGRG